MPIHGIFPRPHTNFDDEMIVAKQSLGSILSVSIEIYPEKCDIAFSVADENPKKPSRYDTTRHGLNEKPLVFCQGTVLCVRLNLGGGLDVFFLWGVVFEAFC